MKRTRINPISKKRQLDMREYAVRRRAFLAFYPKCQVCGENGSTQIHHTKRRGRYYLDETTWLAVCPRCHERIEREPKWAEANGYLDPHRNQRRIVL